MQVKEYQVLLDCVERGVASGINRAHKHSETPSSEHVRSQVIDAVLFEICEYFDFNSEIHKNVDL